MGVITAAAFPLSNAQDIYFTPSLKEAREDGEVYISLTPQPQAETHAATTQYLPDSCRTSSTADCQRCRAIQHRNNYEHHDIAARTSLNAGRRDPRGFGWALETEYSSARPYLTQSVSESVAKKASLSAFYANRGWPFTNARAGRPEILARWQRYPGVTRDAFTVLGKHFYFDPGRSVELFLKSSRATDCNLSEWGAIGWR